MPEINQFVFNQRELLTALVKLADVHEGRWALVINFSINGGIFGPSVDQVAPGVAIAASQFGIQRALPEHPEGIVIDAAEANPEPKRVKG